MPIANEIVFVDHERSSSLKLIMRANWELYNGPQSVKYVNCGGTREVKC